MQTHRTVQDDTGLYKTETADMLLHRGYMARCFVL